MTFFEVLSIVIACIAAFISLIVWNGQRKIQQESLELQRATSDLAKKQLEILVSEDKEKSSARLKLDLVKSGTSCKFYITNIGNVDASNVNFKLLLDKPELSPLISSDLKAKLPAPKLSPGSQISLIAAIHLSSPSAYNALLSWTNPDGQNVEDTTYASM
ncbi:MAG: hypothetical protein GY928_33505 [Colwellia sp.]|nr:hypothetical protein [Colwellia sp.]